MEDQKNFGTMGLAEVFVSIKKIELILEEMLFRQCIHNNKTEEIGKDEFIQAYQNISDGLIKFVSNLPAEESHENH